ncbi:MAG: type II toxin-antitoxin system MqsA family antitoxin [Sarcina sp.]
MTCRDCKGTNFSHKKSNYMCEVDGKFYIVKGVPAMVCDQCGETYYDFNTTLKLEEILDGLKAQDEVTVINYEDKVS